MLLCSKAKVVKHGLFLTYSSLVDWRLETHFIPRKHCTSIALTNLCSSSGGRGCGRPGRDQRSSRRHSVQHPASHGPQPQAFCFQSSGQKCSPPFKPFLSIFKTNSNPSQIAQACDDVAVEPKPKSSVFPPRPPWTICRWDPSLSHRASW